MNNSEIERLLVEATDYFIDPVFNYSLSFDCNNEDAFNAYWNIKSRCWTFDNKFDPLSALLAFNKLERYMLGDDCHQTATAARFIDRPVGWIHSFQAAWKGFDNKSVSISGFVMGRKFRQKYAGL